MQKIPAPPPPPPRAPRPLRPVFTAIKEVLVVDVYQLELVIQLPSTQNVAQ